MEQTLNRIATALESIAASLQDMAAHSRGQLTMELAPPAAPRQSLTVSVVPSGLFEGLEEPKWSEPEPPKPATRNEVIEALNKLAKKHGPQAGIKVLQSCGAAKLAELSEDRYREVIIAAEALL